MNIRSAINRRIESFEINKDHTIRNVLKHLFRKVVLNHLIVDDKLILESNLVKSKVDGIIEDWTRRYRVFDDIFELFKVVSNLSDNKAAGLSGKGVLTNTCSIALIEMSYKIFSKILFNRISLTYSNFDVLYGDNFLVLKGMTIQSPIFAIGLVIEDALKKDWELWLVLQNMRKAYDLVFSPLLWCIFYDPLLCKIKCQKSVYRYKLNFHFISKSGCAKPWAELFSFFVASAFINNTIWMVVIFINSRVSNPSLSISGSPISIIKKKSLSRPSLAKANSNIHFFTNLVLRKAVLDKQLLYLVLVVLYPIVNYRMQFSFISVGVCNKWDALIHKDLKLKSGLLHNFLSNTIHHLFFYGLKFFFQVQFESKIASLVSFANSGNVLGHLFSHRFHDLQVLCWHSVHLLSSSVYICVSTSDNFLADMVSVFLDCNLFLGGSLTNLFWFCSGISMSAVLDESKFFRFLSPLWWHGIAFVDQLHDHHGAVFDWYTFKCWKRLNLYSSVPKWFKLSVVFFNVLGDVSPLNILGSSDFVSVCNHLLQTSTNSLSVYTDESLSNLGTAGCRAGAAIFFEDIELGLGIVVLDLMLSTLVNFVQLFSNSQSALDVCKLELSLVCPNFCNQCWIEHHHIVNVICSKDLEVSWHKIKGYSGISGNEHTNAIASATFFSGWYLLSCLCEHFIMTNNDIVFENSIHFVFGFGSKFLVDSLISEVDWLCLFLVFTSKSSANACTYFIKALHH
ncbi:hypothetical protein G9A89_005785 [Geosiphon pyriformis]|nr:hypothetical protein G9A89_005785 [Geosiphon pyriformis]